MHIPLSNPVGLLTLSDSKMKNKIYLLIVCLLLLSGIQPIFAQYKDDSLLDFQARFESLEPYEIYAEGNELYHRGDFKNALPYFLYVGSKTKSSKVDSLRTLNAESNNICGILYFLCGNYAKSYSYFSDALESGDPKVMPDVYNNMASLYFFYNDLPTTFDYMKKAYDLNLKQGNYNKLMKNVSNLINIGFSRRKLDDVLKIIDNFPESTPANVDTKNWSYVSHIVKGAKNASKSDYEGAYREFENALPYSTVDKINELDEYYVYACMALTALLDKNVDKALPYVRQCMDFAKNNGRQDMLLETYLMMHDCYEEEEKADSANHYRVKWLELRNEIHDSQERTRMNDLEFYTALGKYEKEMDLLSKKEQRQRRNLGIAIGILVFVAIFIIGLVWRYRRLRKRNLELFQRNEAHIKAAQKAQENFNRYRELYEKAIQPVEASEANGEEFGKSSSLANTQMSEDKKFRLEADIVNKVNDIEIVTSPDFSLETLSYLINSNSKYVSAVIKDTFKKSFTTLITEIRIAEACRRLTDHANYGQLTLEAIGESVGFKSRSHFAKVFKAQTGLSPSQYKKLGGETAEMADNKD